jgi:hypothetical protein
LDDLFGNSGPASAGRILFGEITPKKLFAAESGGTERILHDAVRVTIP